MLHGGLILTGLWKCGNETALTYLPHIRREYIMEIKWPGHCHYSCLGNLVFLVIPSGYNNLRCQYCCINNVWIGQNCTDFFYSIYIIWGCYPNEQVAVPLIVFNLSFFPHFSDLTVPPLCLLRVFLLQFMIKPLIFILFVILTASLQSENAFIRKRCFTENIGRLHNFQKDY